MLFRANQPRGQLVGPLQLNGSAAFRGSGTFAAQLVGDLTASDSLTLETSAKVIGTVRARRIDLEGTIHGALEASQIAHLHSTASLATSLTAASVIIEPGAQFQGDLSIGSKR